MNNQLIKYSYEGQEVEFDMTTERVWVNATQMARICNKRINNYLESQSTKEFTSELVKRLNEQLSEKNSRYRDLDENTPNSLNQNPLGDRNSGRQEFYFTEQDVIKIRRGGRKQGTWMDRVQALHFAAWLDARFAVWVFMTIEKILFEQQNLEETRLSEAAVKEIRRKYLENKFAKNPEYVELQSLRGSLSQYLRAPAQQAQTQLDFFINHNNKKKHES